MNRFILSTCICFVFSATLGAQNNSGLILKVTNVKAAKGNIMVAFYQSADNFLGDDIYKGVIIPVESTGEIRYPINDLPKGSYAISIYHDKNENGELDSNLLKIPKEPYGFSNNARGTFGPPSFEKAQIEIVNEGQEVAIRLK